MDDALYKSVGKQDNALCSYICMGYVIKVNTSERQHDMQALDNQFFYFIQNRNAVQSILYTCYIYMTGVVCLVRSIETYALKQKCGGRLFSVENDTECRNLVWFMYIEPEQRNRSE